MTTQELICFDQNTISTSVEKIVSQAFDFAEESLSKNTRNTYTWAWNDYLKWCTSHGMDATTVLEKESLIAFYITDKAANDGFKISTITVSVVAICWGYAKIGISINMKRPEIANVYRGIRRTLPKRPVQKEPIMTEDLRCMIENIPLERKGKMWLTGYRDRALLLVGFSGAFRSSELCSLKLEDVTFTQNGMVLLLRRSKNDQEGEGLEKIIPFGSNPITCPVKNLKEWLRVAKITSGYLFPRMDSHRRVQEKPIQGTTVREVVKRNRHLRGVSEKYSGHSLRAGFVTSAAVTHNVPLEMIMHHTGHKSYDGIMGYVRRGRDFKKTAAGMVGL